MSVLKSKRKESKFEVFHHAFNLRKRLTDVVFRNFGYKPKKRVGETDAQFEIRKSAEEWFIQNEREFLINYTRSLIANLISANSIYPTNAYEYIERRNYQNFAIADCNKILQELQYAIESLYLNVNLYTNLALDIEKETSLIKGWRKSDNRFKKVLEN